MRAAQNCGRDGADALLDDAEPGMRHAARGRADSRSARPALRVAGKARRIRGVLRLGILDALPPSITQPLSRCSPRPPAVADAEVRHAVDAGLHAARAAGFERLARRVEPASHPCARKWATCKIVVVNEGDTPAVDGSRRGDKSAAVTLPGVVSRVRLAGEDDLHVPPLRREQPDQAIGVSEDELGRL